MADEPESEDLEAIKREILKFPHKEFYAGLFDDMQQIICQWVVVLGI